MKKPTDTEIVKKAVKDALDDKRLDDLGNQMTGLAHQMSEGFAKVTTRQDIANGKIQTHAQKFIEIDGKSNYEKIIWLVVTALVGIVTFFLTRG